MKTREIHVYQYDSIIGGPPYRMSLQELTRLDSTIVEMINTLTPVSHHMQHIGYSSCPFKG